MKVLRIAADRVDKLPVDPDGEITQEAAGGMVTQLVGLQWDTLAEHFQDGWNQVKDLVAKDASGAN